MHGWVRATSPLPWTCPLPPVQPPCPGEPLPRLLASCGALSLASLHVIRPGLSLLRSPRQLVTLGQQHHPLLRAAFSPWPTEPSRYSKTRQVNWALKNGTFPECFVCARKCAKGFICIISLKPHYNLEPGNPILHEPRWFNLNSLC